MTRRIVTIAAALAALGMLTATPAWSQTTKTATTQQAGATRPATRLATQYAPLAGSQRNADALIAGLRDGKEVLLSSDPAGPNPTAPSATFTPATGKLGFGNINIALALAKTDLARQGIANPTPAQLAAALNGGTITTPNGTTVVMAGVLAQRQAGLGWGQIAKTMGVTLGSVVSQSKTGHAGKKDGATANNSKKSILSNKSGQSTGNSGNRGGNGNGSGRNNGGGNGSSGSSGSGGGSGGGGGGGGHGK